MGGFQSTSSTEYTSSNKGELENSDCPCYTTEDEKLVSYTRSRGGSLKCKYADGGFLKYTPSKNESKRPANSKKIELEDTSKVYCIDAPANVSYKN